MATVEKIGDWKIAKHEYSVEVNLGHKVTVYADTRARAAKLAKQSGFIVRSVNMIG